MTKKQLQIIKDVYRTSTMRTCGLRQEVQDEMKLWVESWITTPLEMIIKAEDGDEEAKKYIKEYITF